MRELLLTLGHNSSAILVEDGRLIAGYETERFTGIKSDSQFPKPVIEHFGGTFDKLYVTHWAPYGALSNMKSKHWPSDFFSDIPIRTHSDGMSHHDTHAWGVMWFAGPRFPENNTYILVCDGFGNFGEHLSIYKYSGPNVAPKLVQRYFGYGTSLGLMYQYTTAALGLKMNEDEYKLLGYEAHIHQVSVNRSKLELAITRYVHDMLDEMSLTKFMQLNTEDPLVSIDALPRTQLKYNEFYIKLISDLGISNDKFTVRVVISYFVQSVLERVIHTILSQYAITNLMCSGGVFYNVKLNKTIIDAIPGKVSIYPLAGDQGNALGLYHSENPLFAFYGNLCIGPRNLSRKVSVPGICYVPEHKLSSVAEMYLDKFGFVNVVRGAMEFGPRALCNTTTFAIPTRANVDAINRANGRSTIMPMAPVVPIRLAKLMFTDLDKVWRSDQFMIVALRYRGTWGERYEGAAHRYEDGEGFYYTGRPQVISDSHWAHRLVSHYGVLINTSFNAHGQPIVMTTEQIISSHMHQHQIDPRFHTLIALED